MAYTLYLVIPCYNEQEVLPETSKRLREKMLSLLDQGRISKKSRICFVNDGSKDQTWPMILALTKEDSLFAGINLSRNRGHQNALLAGLMTVRERAEVTISMDADLQDDINAIDGFLDEFDKGNDVVYGVRSSRKRDTAFKRGTALFFYKFMGAMGVETVFNHADYRLLSRRALDALADFREVNLFLRGMVPLIGYRSSTVLYERGDRFAGESKYPLKKMLALALDGITSFSVQPLRLIASLGLAIFALSALCLLILLLQKLFGHAVQSFAPILSVIALFSGLQMLALGVVGEYIGKIYQEVKARPRFLIESYVDTSEGEEQ
ncbi:MAG: glycosyltransferase family 2 protein [Christensenellaceae bacterium]|jgi:glycosyltransferase involved in cell wall biosynthesis|nr:glycosyltransferase family 2 protein [Christensenellaceae bacterium]